ncbi:MAG TPA: hypothetical protein VGC24_04585 [Burkholderiaceae bacterium]
MTTAVRESAAFPLVVRVLAVLIVASLAACALWSLPLLRTATWSASSLALFTLAGLSVAWMGWWIVRSRTRLNGDMLTQSWMWGSKTAQVRDVAHLKLVHWRGLENVVAPRLLVRLRNGSMAWFHSADAQLLGAFAEQAAQRAARHD